jgi:hypothetical protein
MMGRLSAGAVLLAVLVAPVAAYAQNAPCLSFIPLAIPTTPTQLTDALIKSIATSAFQEFIARGSPVIGLSTELKVPIGEVLGSFGVDVNSDLRRSQAIKAWREFHSSGVPNAQFTQLVQAAQKSASDLTRACLQQRGVYAYATLGDKPRMFNVTAELNAPPALSEAKVELATGSGVKCSPQGPIVIKDKASHTWKCARDTSWPIEVTVYVIPDNLKKLAPAVQLPRNVELMQCNTDESCAGEAVACLPNRKDPDWIAWNKQAGLEWVFTPENYQIFWGEFANIECGYCDVKGPGANGEEVCKKPARGWHVTGWGSCGKNGGTGSKPCEKVLVKRLIQDPCNCSKLAFAAQ